MNSKNGIRLLISASAVALLLAQFFYPRLKLEPTSLGLVFIAVLPWLSSVIESAKLPGGWEVKFRAVEREQARQREDLDTIIKFLMENFVTDYEMIHLRKLASGEPFPFTYSKSFEAELQRLMGLRLIDRQPGKGIRSLFKEGDDVHNHLIITDRGREYLRHREALQDLLGEHHPA